MLEQAARRARERTAYYRRIGLDLPDRMKRSAEEHVAIFKAIEAGDADRAELLMREHSDIKRTELARFISIISRHSEGRA